MYRIGTFLNAIEPLKLKMVGNTWFFYDIGPFLVFIPSLTEKKLANFSSFGPNFQLFRELKVKGVTFFSCLDR